MAKSHVLPKSARIKIAEYKRDNPELTDLDIAEEFGCTAAQVRYAHAQYKAGKLKRAPRKKSQKAAVKAATLDIPEDELFDKQYHIALAELHEDKSINAAQRIQFLEKLIAIKKNLQVISLKNHISRADAEILLGFAKILRPDVTKDEVIKFWKQAEATFNLEQDFVVMQRGGKK